MLSSRCPAHDRQMGVAEKSYGGAFRHELWTSPCGRSDCDESDCDRAASAVTMAKCLGLATASLHFVLAAKLLVALPL